MAAAATGVATRGPQLLPLPADSSGGVLPRLHRLCSQAASCGEGPASSAACQSGSAAQLCWRLDARAASQAASATEAVLGSRLSPGEAPPPAADDCRRAITSSADRHEAPSTCRRLGQPATAARSFCDLLAVAAGCPPAALLRALSLEHGPSCLPVTVRPSSAAAACLPLSCRLPSLRTPPRQAAAGGCSCGRPPAGPSG